jgi:hypothetical protein
MNNGFRNCVTLVWVDFSHCHIIGNSILIGAKHEITRAQILVYSQSITGTKQTDDQQKFVTFISRELSMNQ